MFQEYITEVQSHIVARSFNIPGSSEFTALRSKLTEELSHARFPPSPTHRSQHSSQEDVQIPKEMSLPYASQGGSDGGSDQSAANTLEAIHNMGMLQSKIMSLQGEALRVTYAIDYVNQCMVDWHQHKEDFKRAVQRRSAQFQFFIKRMEHQLLTHVDDKHVDDEFYATTDKSKTELRKVLKNILHEVSVLKSIQELGKESEINILSQNLLGKSVGMTDVMLKKLHYEMEVPTESIEEIVTTCFGEVRLYPEESNIFSPELTDFTEVSVGNLTQQQSEEDLSSSDREIAILEDEDHDVPTDRTSSIRSLSDSSYAIYSTDPSLDDHTRQHIVQFETARETLRTRRREILVRGQKAREGASSLMDEFHGHPRSAMRKSRVQSLDRSAAPFMKISSKRELVAKSNVHQSTDVISKQSDTNSLRHSKRALDTQHEPAHVSLRASGPSHGFITENVNIPSPLTEEVCFPSVPHRKLVKQTSDSHVTAEEVAGSDVCLPSHTQSVMENLNRHLLDPTGTNLFPQRRHSSDHYIPASNGEDKVLDLIHDRTFTRPVRRAISSVANKKQKMEILRENWQKRKEILIQNEGFVSPVNVARLTSKPSSHMPFQISSSNPSISTTHKGASETESHTMQSPDEHSYQGEEPCHKNELTTTEETYPDDTLELQITTTNSLDTKDSITASVATAADVTTKPCAFRYQTENRTDITMPSNETKSINLESIDQHQPRQYLYEVKIGDRVNRRHSTDTVTSSKDKQTMDHTAGESHETNGATSHIPVSSTTDSDETLLDQGAAPEQAEASPSPSSSPQPPSSPTAGDGLQKLKLREIARKKKERWRHLTIH